MRRSGIAFRLSLSKLALPEKTGPPAARERSGSSTTEAVVSPRSLGTQKVATRTQANQRLSNEVLG